MPVRSDDILDGVKTVERLLAKRLAEGAPTADEVWLLYARAEKLTAILKFRMEVERPGFFTELPRSESPEEFLPVALDALTTAVTSLEMGDVIAGLESLRKGRTFLRAFLASERRLRRRTTRRRVPAGRPSAEVPRSPPRRSLRRPRPSP